MSTYVWCELVCDHCSATISGEFSTSDRIPRTSLKKDAKEKGAVFSGDDVFCSEGHRLAAQPESIKKEPRHEA